MVKGLAENPKESQSDPHLSDGQTEAQVGAWSCPIHHPRACLATSAALRPRISVNRERKSFITTQRPSPKGPTRAWHRCSVTPFKTPRGTGITSTMKWSCVCQPEGL